MSYGCRKIPVPVLVLVFLLLFGGCGRDEIVELAPLSGEAETAEAARAFRLRAEELLPLLREMRELTVLTARYYDRSYHKHERYTL